MNNQIHHLLEQVTIELRVLKEKSQLYPIDYFENNEVAINLIQ